MLVYFSKAFAAPVIDSLDHRVSCEKLALGGPFRNVREPLLTAQSAAQHARFFPLASLMLDFVYLT